MHLIRRFWPLLLLLLAVVAIWASGLAHQISWEALARHQTALAGWVVAHPIVAPVLYILGYAVAVALSLPQAAIVTAAGGLLFGTLFGGALAIVGSSLGAVGLFLAVRYQFAGTLAERGGGLLDRLRPSLERDGFSYLLAIRLVPLFPFWLVNLAAALSGMRLLPYATATVLGITPVVFVYASIGAGLGEVLAMGRHPDLTVIVSPRVLGPLAGLAALSLLPVAWRRWKRADA